ncbi:MAG: sensor histidine kinase [Panacagrimonas sp.]
MLLDDTAREFSLAGHLEAFHDETGSLTQQDVSSAAHAQRFAPMPGYFNGGYSRKGAWWLRFEIQAAPSGAGDWWLHLGPPNIDYVDVWLPERTAGGETLRHRALGGLRPVSARDLPSAVTMLRLPPLPQGEVRWIWIRLASERTLSLTGHVFRLDAMADYIQMFNVNSAGLIGMMLIMAMVALALGVALPDGTFLWYSAYLGSGALMMLCSQDMLAALLLPDRPLLAVRTHNLAMCLNLFTSIVFARSLLQMPVQFPRTGAVFRILAGLSAVACLAALAGYYGAIAPEVNLLRILLAPPIVVLCGVLVRRGQPGARLNLLGYLAYLLLGLLPFASALNLLPITYLTKAGYPAGVIVHMLAIFLSLGLRVRSRERQALAASQEAGVRLEANVAARTRELRVEVEERQRAQAQLQTAMVEQRNFLSMVSHELRTPLSVIGASAEMITDERLTSGRDDVQREAAKIGRAKQRMLGLVETLLAEEWLNSSAVQLHRSDVDLADLLAERAQDHTLGSRREIRFEASGDLRVHADERLLHIVFDNLIENAIKYSPDGGAIDVTARCQDGGVVVAVRDCGKGFDAADVDRVFERYYRASTVRRKPGVGLGLYMVRRIVELHGGRVRADNAESGGAVLTVLLPTEMLAATDLPASTASTARKTA